MIDDIYQDPDLCGLTRQLCEENDICAKVSESIPEEDVLILKVDHYYSSTFMHNPPPSVDCLIIVKCRENECHDLYLVELRNVKSTRGFKVKQIESKFRTIVEDFMEKRFAYIFMNEDYCINAFRMYFVSDACGIKKRFPNITEEIYYKKILNTKLDMLQLLKPLRFRDKIAHIDPRLPDPLVEPC